MILTNPKNKKHIEAIIKYCKDNGMEPLSTMGLWNHLLKLFKRIEKAESKAAPKNTAPNKRFGGSPVSQAQPKCLAQK